MAANLVDFRAMVEENPNERLDKNKGIFEGASCRRSSERHSLNFFCSYDKIFEPRWYLQSKDSFGV